MVLVAEFHTSLAKFLIEIIFMAMNILVKFPFLGLESSNPTIPNGKKPRKLASKLNFENGQQRSRGVGCENFESGVNYEVYEKTRVRELVAQLRCCVEKKKLKEARAIHCFVMKSDLADENLLVLLNHVMYVYLKCLDFSKAKVVFDNLPSKNVFSCSVMIIGSNEHGLFLDGLSYFFKIMDQGILLDKFSCCATLQSCVGLNCVDLGKMVHAQIIARGLTNHVVVSTALFNMYAKLSEIKEAYGVFNSMAEHNDVSWNAMISGLTTNGLHLEAFDHFLRMKKRGFTPNMYTFLSVSKAVGMLIDVNKANQVNQYASELGLLTNVRVGTSLIDMYSKCGALLQARSIFDMHFANCGVNAPWNAMIGGYSVCKWSQQALELYVTMCQNDIKSDTYTYCSVFDAIADLKCYSFVREVHGMLLKFGYALMDLSVQNAIADAYSKCGYIENVEKIFNRMTHRDVVSWTTLVTAYCQCGKWEEALINFTWMREEGFTPNHYTLASILTACSHLCYIEYGYQIHGLLCKLGFEADRCIESALIDMYAKGGSIVDAETVFKRISNPDVVSLTAIISGYAHHGSVANALQQFRSMEQMGIKPNVVTLLCVLFACSHAGLVDKGLNYFWSMEKTYDLVPKMEHYACVVDLLGRVGHLDEALDFILKMPIQPNEMVWQTLLAACRVHSNVKIGEIAAKKILSLYPEYSSTYVLLSNTYMEAGSFRDGVHLRNVMKEQGVRKDPGYSWINVKGRVHRFYAGDREHPQKNDIYLLLQELRRKMKALGYTPDLRYALQDKTLHCDSVLQSNPFVQPIPSSTQKKKKSKKNGKAVQTVKDKDTAAQDSLKDESAPYSSIVDLWEEKGTLVPLLRVNRFF